MMVLRVLLLVVLPGTTMGWSANSATYNYPRSSSTSYSSSWSNSNSNSNNVNGGGVSIYPPSSFRYSKTSPSVNYYYQEDGNNYSVGPRYQYTRSNNNNNNYNNKQQQSLNRYDRFSAASLDYYNTNNDNYYYNNAQDKPQVYPTSRYSVGGRTSSSYRLGYGGEYEDRDAYAPRRGSGSGRGRQEQRYGDAANGWSSYGSSSSAMQRYSAPRRRSNIQDKYYGDEYYALSPDNVDSVTGLGKRASYSNNNDNYGDSYYPSNNNMVRYQSPDTRRSNYNSMNQYNNFPSTKQPTRRLSSSSSYPSFVPTRGYNENSYYSAASNNQDSYYYSSNNNYSNTRYTQPSLQRSW